LSLGIQVENRLNERDEKGRPKYTLEKALGIPFEPRPVNVGRLLARGARLKH